VGAVGSRVCGWEILLNAVTKNRRADFLQKTQTTASERALLAHSTAVTSSKSKRKKPQGRKIRHMCQTKEPSKMSVERKHLPRVAAIHAAIKPERRWEGVIKGDGDDEKGSHQNASIQNLLISKTGCGVLKPPHGTGARSKRRTAENASASKRTGRMPQSSSAVESYRDVWSRGPSRIIPPGSDPHGVLMLGSLGSCLVALVTNRIAQQSKSGFRRRVSSKGAIDGPRAKRRIGPFSRHVAHFRSG